MGYWKDVRERLGGGNPETHDDEHVCAACFGDDALKGLIESEACARTCTFCGARAERPIAAPLVDVLLYISECLDREYDVAENKLTRDEDEWMGETWTTREILDAHLGLGLPNDNDERLRDALCDGLGERVWCRVHPYSLTDDEKLNFSWDEFCELIKHRRRYLFVREERTDEELFDPLALLQELARWCARFELVKPLAAQSTVYRARFQKPGDVWTTAAELGPPPKDKAVMANRMSPPGIVMLYVSDESETALRETAKDPKEHAGRYAIGAFRTLRECRILDLTGVPPVPSIFAPIPDSIEFDPRPPLIFLNYFAAELSKPIARDRSIHVEYIPAQVITEYFRTEFVHDDRPIDGIRYLSARHADHWSLVLFATQDDLVDEIPSAEGPWLQRSEPWVELVGREEREISRAALERWEREAPPVFEWI